MQRFVPFVELFYICYAISLSLPFFGRSEQVLCVCVCVRAGGRRLKAASTMKRMAILC